MSSVLSSLSAPESRTAHTSPQALPGGQQHCPPACPQLAEPLLLLLAHFTQSPPFICKEMIREKRK